MMAYGINKGQGWGGGFYWKGGGAQVSAGEENYTTPLISSPYFGWQVVCGASTCDGVHQARRELAVLGMELAAVRLSGPPLTQSPKAWVPPPAG